MQENGRKHIKKFAKSSVFCSPNMQPLLICDFSLLLTIKSNNSQSFLLVGLFLLSFRLPSGSSLFDTLPTHLSTLETSTYCTCGVDSRIPPPRTGPEGTTSSDTSCSNHGNVRFHGVIPTLDVTARFIQSMELRTRNKSRRLSQSANDRWGKKQSQGRGFSSGQRQQRRAEPQPQRHMPTYYFPEDHEAPVQPGASPTWPTPSGLTRRQAWTQCQLAVENSSTAVGCRLLLEDTLLSRVVAMCITDLQLKDDNSWLRATLPLLENECERRLMEEERRREEYRDAATILRCPNLCNGNGQCSEWGCVCFPGFGSYDCSVLSGKTLNYYLFSPEILN